MNAEVAKKTLMARKRIDSGDRYYIYNEAAEDSYKKEYSYVEPAKRLLRFSADIVGTLSDCYLLYAVAYLGVTDRTTIQLFLKNIKTRNPRLYIEDPEDDDNVMNRLGFLAKAGFLFIHNYYAHDYTEEKEGAYARRLYTIDREGCTLLNQKLSKNVPYNAWIQAKSLNELIAWASGAYIGAFLSTDRNFSEYLDGVFRNRFMGAYYFPCELKFVVGDVPAYVAIETSYLHFDDRSMTQDDYDNARVRKINAIKNYILGRSKKGPAYAVIVVQDNEDLMKMAELISQTGVLEELLERIYFTGEGAVRTKSSLQDAFLQLVRVDENGDRTMDFVIKHPDFLS